MKLIDLDPQFIRYESRIETWQQIVGDHETWRERGCPTKDVTGPREHRLFVPNLTEAQGITFLCPKCFATLGGASGVHLVEVTFSGRDVADALGTHNRNGDPVRWSVAGSGFANLTTQPSILVDSAGGCAWHGFVTNGEVT